MELFFNWQITGHKNGDDVLYVEIHGHEALEIHGHKAHCVKSFEKSNNDDWWVSIDGNKYSGLKGKDAAQAYVEKTITEKVKQRINTCGIIDNQPTLCHQCQSWPQLLILS